ncbi:MAG: hypothetical protein HYW86_00215 [Candidatus Roizmanbacteria bacterium]|nr:MAG: hypothetical protein HYW86_00215 [Candidatus Roizmanbacteria bacterium]
MNNQKGQVLLIVIMLLATVSTVVMSITFKSITETQTTKLEEEAQKALAAAEAGIEQMLGTGSTATVVLDSLPSLSGSGITGQTTIASVSVPAKFNSARVSQDQQYTFYLDDYYNGTFAGSPYIGNITLYYGDSVGCSLMALEISILTGVSPTYTLTRYIADTGDNLTSDTEERGLDISASPISINDGSLNIAYNCRTSPSITVPAQAKLMIIRAIGNGTRLGFDGSASLKTQGKIISSEAKTQAGVTRRVQLFQSYPQIPSDFFVTSF